MLFIPALRNAVTSADRRSLAPMVAAAITLAVGSALILYGAFRGLDLTDETFYLISINDPGAYALSYQPFGHVLAPLFALLDRSLPALRIVTFIAVVAAGSLLGHHCGRYAGLGSMALAGAASSLALYFSWIITPNYNLLANVGLALIIAGVLAGPWRVGALLIGVGGYLVFFGKPTTAALAALILAALLAVPRVRREQRLLLRGAMAGAIAFILIVATVGLDLVGFVGNILAAQDTLGLSNSLGALPLKTAHELYDAPPLLLVAATVTLGVFVTPRSEAWKFIILPLIAAALLVLAFRTLQGFTIHPRPTEFGLTMTALCLLAIALAVSLSGAPKSSFALPVALVLAPYVVAFGTFNDILEQTTGSLLFPILALCLVARLAAWPALELATYALALACLLIGFFRPYGYAAPVFAQSEALRTRLFKGPLLVDPMTKDYADSLGRVGVDAPILDLTGNGPGTVALTGAKAPVLPWIITLTPQWADVVWNRLPTRDQAWIIGPVAPAFANSAAARHMREGNYRCSSLAPMKFWDRIQLITLCKPASLSPPSRPRTAVRSPPTTRRR